jgi:hypothetical protein
MKIPNLRWWLAILVAAGIALSYLDRLNFPVAYSEIQRPSAYPIANMAG